VNVPNVWKGDRNPVRYSTVDEVKEWGVDISKLKWMPMPKAKPEDDAETEPKTARDIRPLSMIDAKRGLALTFGVPPEAIEITIRG
jgi:hypothetical protein